MTTTKNAPSEPADSGVDLSPRVYHRPKISSIAQLLSPDAPKLISSADAGRILQVTQTTAMKAVKAGHLPSVKLGATNFIPRKKFLAWYDETIESIGLQDLAA